MKPVTNTLPSVSPARTAASTDTGSGERFASLFSSLTSASPAPQQAPAAQAAPSQAAVQKPSQAKADDAVQSEPPVTQAPRENMPAANDGKADATQSSQNQGADAASQTEDESDTVAQAGVGMPDANAQLLALAQLPQGQLQDGQAAGKAKAELPTDAANDRRAQNARGAGRADALAAEAEDLVSDAGPLQASKDADFIGHIADAQALQQGKAGARFEDSLNAVQTRQDSTALAAAAPAATATAARSAEALGAARAASEQLAPRVGSTGWDRALGQKVVWMVGQGEQSASLTLNPPDLGPLQVVLSVSQSSATADFSAAQPEVRQALQDALPKLREMLAEAGISLGQANVHAGTGEQAQQTHQGGQGSANRGGSGKTDRQAEGADNSRPAQALRQGTGLVNTYV